MILRSHTGKNGLTLRFTPYTIKLSRPFRLSGSSRDTTPAIITLIEYEGLTGYGEASLPPYLGESQESVSGFLSSLNLGRIDNPLQLDKILSYVDNHLPGNYAARASVDIALHDLAGKLAGLPLHRMLDLNPQEAPFTSFTIGIDSPEIVRQKVMEALPYKILKVKLGAKNDREMIEAIRSVTDKPLCVDVNQGWIDKVYALEMIHWLKENNVLFVEQPLPAVQADDMAWLKSKSPLPVIGDEAIRDMADLVKYGDAYTGVNVKLMKCGGIRSARIMLETAKKMGLKTMIGCMTETSCAITAAAHLSPLADWCDLDGNLLISNDIFEGAKVKDGRITLPPDSSGLGIKLLQELKLP